jgi:hypothetical protein
MLVSFMEFQSDLQIQLLYGPILHFCQEFVMKTFVALVSIGLAIIVQAAPTPQQVGQQGAR